MSEARASGGEGAAGEPAADASFDAGDMGCGELLVELRARLLALAPGALLVVRASDPGAVQDLPAWCRVTGHRLERHERDRYWIRRRPQPAGA